MGSSGAERAPTRGRDSERSRCYAAEDAAFGGTTLTTDLDHRSVVALVASVTHQRWWRQLEVPDPVVTTARADARRSSADGTTIRIAPGGRQALTVVHELAHHLTIGLAHPDPGHGPWFRAAELELVGLVAGERSRGHLTDAFATHRLTVASWDRPPAPTTGRTDLLVHRGPDRIRGAVALPRATGEGRATTQRDRQD